MPMYTFECPPQQRIAGCVEKIVVRTPFLKGKFHPNGAPVIDPRTNRQVPEPDSQQTWAWVAQQRLPLPPSANFSGSIQSYTADANLPPEVIATQYTQQQVQAHAQIHAPYGQPVGNAGAYQPPPMVDPRYQNPAAKIYRQDQWEPLDGAALPGGTDPMLGDVDPAGGTFTDIDSAGNEIQRQDIMPVAPRNVPR